MTRYNSRKNISRKSYQFSIKRFKIRNINIYYFRSIFFYFFFL